MGSPDLSRLARSMLLVAGLAAMAACGGGSDDSGDGAGDGAGSGSSSDTTAPTATMNFPTHDLVYVKGMIPVSGTADDDSAIQSVTVNGVSATSTDDFATWTAQVPVTADPAELTVETTDVHGNTDSQAVTQPLTVSEPVMGFPTQALLTDDGKTLYIPDSATGGIWSFDVVSRVLSVLAGMGQGDGMTMANPRQIAFGASEDVLYVAEAIGGAILELDVATGDRTPVASDSVGSGTAMQDRVTGVAYDAANDRVLFTELMGSGEGRVVSLDPATKVRTEVSGPAAGSGDPMNYPRDLVVNDAGTKALLSDYTAGKVFEIDLVSGDRRVVASDTVGTGPTPFGTKGATDTQDTGTVYLAGFDTRNGFESAALAVNIMTGDRTVVSSNSVGSGPTFTSLDWLVDEPATSALLAGVPNDGAIFRITKASGDRTRLVSDTVSAATGPLWGGSLYDAVTTDDGRFAYVVGSDRVVKVDLSTGTRTLVSDTLGISTPTTIALDETAGTLYLSNEYAQPAEVAGLDVAGGQGQIVYTPPQTTYGYKMTSATDMVFDDTSNRLVILGKGDVTAEDQSFVAELELLGEQLKVVSSSDTGAGSGDAIVAPTGIAVDDTGQYAYIDKKPSGSGNAVLKIDMTTGDRSVLSDNTSAYSGPKLGLTEILGMHGSQLWVADNIDNSILAVDPASGDRTLVTALAETNGTRIGFVHGAAESSDGDIVIVDTGMGAIGRLHRPTGGYGWLSR